MKYKKKGKPSLHILMNPPIKEPKKTKTGELELFKKIAMERAITGFWEKWVLAKHINSYWEIGNKTIQMDNLTVTNFSHIVGKGRDKTKRLDPKNIEIVSRAYHEWQHSLQIPQLEYIN